MAYMFRGKQSIGFRDQSDLSTPAATGTSTDWQWPICDAIEPQWGDQAEVSEMRLTRAAGASPKPDVGTRDGTTFKLRGPLLGQLSTYDHTSDTPIASPMMQLLMECIGTKFTAVYDAGDIAAASTTTLLKTTSGTYKGGALVPYADSGEDDLVGLGWITGQSTQDLSLADPAVTAGATGGDTWASVNAYTDYVSPTPKTFRVTGRNAAEDLRLIGCMPTAWQIMVVEGALYAEIDYIATDWTWEASGGLVTPLAYVKLPSITTKLNAQSDHPGARMLLDSAAACPLSDWEVAGTLSYSEAGPVGRQGVCERVVDDREITISFTKPIDDGDITANELDWDADYEANTPIELSFFLGYIAGAVLSWYAPSLFIAERPTEVLIGKRRIGRRVVCKLDAYSGDTLGAGDTAAENTSFRIACA